MPMARRGGALLLSQHKDEGFKVITKLHSCFNLVWATMTILVKQNKSMGGVES